MNTTLHLLDAPTIPQALEVQASDVPDKIALCFENQQLSYKELNQQANQLAHFLRSLGAKPDTLIAVCLYPSLHLMVGILGILKAGSAYVPLDPSYPIERLQFMLADTQSPIIITEKKLSHLFKNCQARIICLDTFKKQIAEYPETNLTPLHNLDNLAYVIYTSGSTGKPKGVMILHRNLNHFINWYSKALSVTPADIFDFSSSISFDFSVPNTLFPVTVGAKIAVCPVSKKDPNLYINHLIDNQVTILKITPSQFRQVKEFINKNQKFSALRWIVFGGETLFAKDISDWLTTFPKHRILNEYGPTETTVATSWIMVDKDTIHRYSNKIPIGKPALNSQLYILDEDLQPTIGGNVGELYIGGGGVAKGYLNCFEETQEKFIQNSILGNAILYKSGDLCRYRDDGNIEFIGRIDHQVKIRGFRVELDEVEACLGTHPLIKDVVVVAQEDDVTNEKQIIAYFIPHQFENIPSPQSLTHYLDKYLPHYMVPATFVVMQSFPLTVNGKIDRKALQLADVMVSESYTAPRTELEKLLIDIWKPIFQLDSIGINDNFFELGGNSLSAAKIISKIKKIIKKEINLKDFYLKPTISGLAETIRHAPAVSENELIHNKTILNSKIVSLSQMQFMFWLTQIIYSISIQLNVVDRRRIQGRLDLSKLNSAFNIVLKKHPILSYHISRFVPQQLLQENIFIAVECQDISSLHAQQKENELFNSLTVLKKLRNWKKGLPLLIAKLFYLENDESELQICLPHIISDESSPEILFNDVANEYNKINDSSFITETDVAITPFSYYIYQESKYVNSKLKKGMHFWLEYLNNVNLFKFPDDMIIRVNEASGLSYSTYLAFPKKLLPQLKRFCNKHNLSLTDCLCAAVCKALASYVEEPDTDKSLVINLLKSTRNNEIYDQTVGFFVSANLLKMKVNDHPSLAELSKRVQDSTVETESYQPVPSIIKLTYFFKKNWQNKVISQWIIKIVSWCISKIFYKWKLNYYILCMYGHLFFGGIQKNFLVQINILNNFLTTNEEPKQLFGHTLQKVPVYKENRITAKNVLDICFFKDTENHAYLLLSSHLKPAFREVIGNKILKIIQTESND